MPVARWRRRISEVRGALCLLLALLMTLSACVAPGSRRYLPANAGIDPFGSARARAEQFYENGLSYENQGNWRKALDDYRQARLWDPDNRQDIQDALRRAQAQTATQP